MSKTTRRTYFASIILPYVASTRPITVYILRNFMLARPYELEEAALLDGCGIVRAFARIFIPCVKHSLVVVSVIPLFAAYLLFTDVLEKGMAAGALK